MGLSERIQGSVLSPIDYETDCIAFVDPLMPTFGSVEEAPVPMDTVSPFHINLINFPSYGPQE